MVEEEVRGSSMEEDWPRTNEREILREAGRQLARIHRIEVDGFGWIDRNSYVKLAGEKRTFDEYFSEYLENDLQALSQLPFSYEERSGITSLIMTARQMLDVREAVLVHGDFDISHIYHSAGRYSGIIDFGEIRGNNRLFDFATFIGFYQDREAYSCLLEGYREMECLTDRDLYAAELFALFILLRFLGKAASAGAREHWFRLTKRQFCQVSGLS
jgi:Ser/Thr protein kinase RdoA (MazF antagonist)